MGVESMTNRPPTDRLDRRKYLKTTATAGVILGFAGCLGGDADNDVDQAVGEDDDADDAAEPDDDDEIDDDADDADEEFDDVEISLTALWTGGEQEDFEAVMEYVEGETGIDISYQPRDTEPLLTQTLMDYEAEVATADIVVIPMPARVRTDGEAGHLEPVGDIWDPEEYAADPNPVTVDDEVYAAPFGMDLKPGFWYRESFFDEHGLEEPGDYDEFLDLLEEIDGIEGVEAPLASGNEVGWPLSDVIEAYILRQEDGAQLQEDLIAGEAEMTDDRVYTAFEEVQETLQDGYWSDLREFGVQYEFFWENEIPLYFMGSWTPAFPAIEDPDDLNVFMLPGTESMVASINWFTIPTYSEEVDAARAALEEIVSADGQQVWTERGGFVPSHDGVPDEAFEAEIMSDLVDMADEVTLVPDLDDSLGDPFQSEFWSQLLGFWVEPDEDIDGIIERLDTAHQETVAEDDEPPEEDDE